MTADQVDAHDPAGFAGWLRMRAEENRRVAALPLNQWPTHPHVLKHLAFRFDQGAELFDRVTADLALAQGLAAGRNERIALIAEERDKARSLIDVIEGLAAGNITGCGTCTTIINTIRAHTREAKP